MKKLTLIAACLFIWTSLTYAQNAPKGKLVIIGATMTTEMTNAIIEAAGGENAKIAVVPMAAGDNEEAAAYDMEIFKKAGAKNVTYIACNKEGANTDSIVNLLKGVTGIFFSGGMQSDLVKALLDTRLLTGIKNIYKNGGVISGSSAGAAVLGAKTITGQELIDTTSQTDKFKTIQKNNVETLEGFNFIDDAVVDQFFVVRKRNNRLISVVLQNPRLLGIGIDDNAAVVLGNGVFKVLGESQVIVFDASKANVSTTEKGLYKANKISQFILTAGDKFDVKKREVVK